PQVVRDQQRIEAVKSSALEEPGPDPVELGTNLGRREVVEPPLRQLFRTDAEEPASGSIAGDEAPIPVRDEARLRAVLEGGTEERARRLRARLRSGKVLVRISLVGTQHGQVDARQVVRHGAEAETRTTAAGKLDLDLVGELPVLAKPAPLGSRHRCGARRAQ